MPGRVSPLFPVIAAVGLAPAIALGADVAAIKPGLWQAITQAAGQSMTMTMCMGDPKDMFAQVQADHPRPARSATDKPACAPPKITPTADGFEQVLDCGQGGRTRVLASITDNGTQMHVATSQVVDGGETPLVTMDLRRIGECPAGMKPGQASVASTGAAP